MDAKNFSTLFSSEIIAKRIEELAKEINEDYKGKELLVIGILKGSFIFMADLVRKLSVPLYCDFISLSSYGNAQTSSGKITLHMDIRSSVEGKHALVVEDIIDSGLTFHYIEKLLRKKKVASVRFCALLQKKSMTGEKLPLDYKGFSVDNEFVIGYGLDDAGRYRELPHIVKKIEEA